MAIGRALRSLPRKSGPPRGAARPLVARRPSPGTLKAIETPMREVLAVVPIRTPWKSLSAAEKGREYLAMVSYFRLRSARVLPTFALNTLRIERQLARSEGLVGHSGADGP